MQRVWEQAAGPAIAREAAPVSERAGTVTLECSSAVWMQEIDLMGPTLVEQLNALLGGERVSGVRCVATTGRRAAVRAAAERHPAPKVRDAGLRICHFAGLL